VPEQPLAHRLSHADSVSSLARKLACGDLVPRNLGPSTEDGPALFGDLIGALPVTSRAQSDGLPTTPSWPQVLLPPVEPNQCTSISFAETAALEGIAASIGSVGDAHDNALAESTIGLFKTEEVSKSSPFLQGAIKTIDDIEFATIEWVDWFNTRRLHSTLNYVTPDEFEAVYYSQLSILQPEMSPA
jgi:hypothetical protein